MTISIMNNERLSETICITIGDLKRSLSPQTFGIGAGLRWQQTSKLVLLIVNNVIKQFYR